MPGTRLVSLALAVFARVAFTLSHAAAVAPVVVSAIPDTTVTEDSAPIENYRRLTSVFADFEDLKALAFTIELNSDPSLVTAAIDADSALDLSFVPNASGSATLVIRATDSELLFAQDTLVVAVSAVNDNPTIVSAIPDVVVLVDAPPIENHVDLNGVFTDIEDASALAFSILANSAPSVANVSIDADSALDLSFFPDTHGRATIVVRARDSGGAFVDETFVVSVHRSLWSVEADGSGHEPTIQAAINLAFDGDTILLGDGTYTGAGNRGMNLGGRDLVITSRNGPAVTVIDLEGAERGFLMDNVGPAAVLSDITIKNGRQHQGACIKMSGASPTISGMILIDNAASMDGGAVYCDGGSSPAITNCVLVGNSAASGGGVYSNASSPVIENCTIVESRATSGGAGIHTRNSGGRVTNTIVASSTQGPGMACTLGSNPTVSCTDVFGNAGGDAVCGVDGGGNFSADPLFCVPPADGDVSIASNSPCAPANNPCGVLVGALGVACGSGPVLLDAANTLYPAATFAAEPGLTLHLGLNNFSSTGVMLDTTSTVTFSDSVHAFTSRLANRSYVPGGASNFTVRFAPAPVPSGMDAPASYGLRLHLTGVDDSSEVYDAAFTTAGRNAILVDTPKVIASALPLRVEKTLPGARDVPLLAILFQNGYGGGRTLDTLVVANMTFGPGAANELDAEVETLHLFDDVDGSGDLSGPDVRLARSAWVSGEALFAVNGSWSVPALSSRNLIVAADIDSVLARDGDDVDAALVSPANVIFREETEINDSFSPLYPLDSFGYATVDGMARHQIGVFPSDADTLAGGATDVWIVTLVVPQNGYAADTLTALSIKDYGGDPAPDDLAALRIWRDTGDGMFDTATDLRLGVLVYSGDRYQISGLREALAPPARFFVTADVASGALDGHRFRPGVPLGGIEVASSNDGPVDLAAISATTHVIENPEVVEVTGATFAPDAAWPGADDARLLRLAVRNRTRQAVTLDTLTLWNTSRGRGTPDDLDRTFRSIRVRRDDGDGVIDPWDPVVADGLRFVSGVLVASGLALDIASDETALLIVSSDIDSVCAADGDTLAVSVGGPQEVGITAAHPVVGTFPVSTPAPVIVDGMRAFQIAIRPAADTLVVTGGSNILLLDFGVPANGYAPDTLRTLTIRNEGTATSEHFERIVLWADGGNGRYDAGLGDDAPLGDFIENPAEPNRSFLVAGLGVPLTGACGTHTRLFASADIASQYSAAGTIRFAVPVMGLSVASGNDGPTDRAVVEPSLMLIPKPDRLTVFPYPVGDQVVFPGSKGRLNTGVGFYNGYENPFTLQAIKLYQAGTASSAEIDSVFAYADSNGDGLFDPGADARVGALPASGVSYVFGSLGVLLEPRKITYVFATYDLPLVVTDAATIDTKIFDSTDITVDPPGAQIEGDFPINSPGTDTVDGMISRQVAIGYVPAYNASPGNQNVPALNLVIPANGIWADRLEAIVVENAGTARGGVDIDRMRLWKEAGGDPARYDAGMEEPIGGLEWNGLSWSNENPLGVPVPVTGLRCYVTFSVTAAPGDGVTVRARVPLEGIEMESGNDGPLDTAIANGTVQTVSTDPLVATLYTDRLSYSVGQTIVLSMAVRNEGLDALTGVHPSLPSLAGAGSAALVTSPNPASVDLAPGERTTFVWTYTAASAGDVDFCGRAWSADSLVFSEESCTGPASLQNRPTGVSVALENLAPSSVNRGQQAVNFFDLDAVYAPADTLGAVLQLSGMVIRFEDRSGAPLAPNSVLRKIAFTPAGGIRQELTVSDSTSPVLRLTMPQAIAVAPGGSIRLTADGDVSSSAALTSFVMRIETLSDVRLVDANDGTAVAAASTETFPWSTAPIAVNSPAESLLVDSGNGATKTVNVGQDDVRMFTIEFTHPGDPSRARVILTDFTLGFLDLSGTAVTAGAVAKNLRIVTEASTLFEGDVAAGSSSTLSIALQTPLVLPPGSKQTVDVVVDVKNLPLAEGFTVVLATAQSLVARDINSGRIVAVGPLDPALRSFPFSSDRIVFQNPASGILASHVDRLPPAVLPSARAVPVMDIVVSHGGAAPASSVRVDSLNIEFSFSGGASVFPGDYFSAIVVTHEGDTIYRASTLSGAAPAVGCRLSQPVLVAPSDRETLSILLDTRPVFSPSAVAVRIHQTGLVVIDANDGVRFFGIEGEFPLLAGPVPLQLPTSGVATKLVARAPANVGTTTPNLEAFDFVLKNGGSSGSTPVELAGLRVRVQDARGRAMEPASIVAAARLVTRDSTVVDGTTSASSIGFTLPAGLVRVSGGATDTVSVFLDIETDLGDANFRLAIEDSLAVDVLDGVTASPVPVVAASGDFPLVTRWIHLLGASVQSAYTNYPNPFAAGRDRTTITYYLDQRSTVTLKLYTLWGAPVLTLIDNVVQPSGLYQDVHWDGRNGDGDVVNNGVYYLVLELRGENGQEATLKRKVGVIR